MGWKVRAGRKEKDWTLQECPGCSSSSPQFPEPSSSLSGLLTAVGRAAGQHRAKLGKGVR